jgi:YidC/Oxa1 family membrane protein insertase
LAETILRDTQNEVVVSPLGGGIRHWRLKLKGEEVDLVAQPEAQPLPLSSFPNAVFDVRQEGRSLQMSARLDQGVRLVKTLTLSADGYLHDLTYRFENPTNQTIEVNDWDWGWGPGLGTIKSEQKENSRQTRAITMGRLKATPLEAGDYTEFGQWSALDNRYFLVAFLPVQATQPSLHVAGKHEHTTVKVRQNVSIPAKGSTELRYQLYVGPKGYTQLGHYNKGLEHAVNFGWFSALGKLILKMTYWLQRQTGNYGWAIIILTILLQLLLLPLSLKSYKSMWAMKALQPQIAKIQQAYKSDPKRLNIEMMNLYKKSGTNPFGGCLPMFLQLPIFWALFTTLRNAYELRGAPWIGWVHDLSAHDPYYVLPVVMGLAMLVQQRVSGASTDPTQRQMMYMMPIVFTIMFMKFPAGLVLYWLIQNLFGLAVQASIARKHKAVPTMYPV